MEVIPIAEITKLLVKARSAKDIFGKDLDSKVHAKFLVALHPDRNPGDTHVDGLRDRIEKWWATRNDPPLTIKSPKREYQFINLLAVGDVADVHLATATINKEVKDYAIKISRIKDGHKMLLNEQKMIIELLEAAGTKVYARMLPTLVESFPAKDPGKSLIQKHVNIFLYEAGYYDAAVVRAQHPNLDGRHLVWLLKRMLMICGFIHNQKVIHGAILPTHLRIHAENHGLQLVGWGQSIDVGEKLKSYSVGYKDWYPKEVFDKKPLTPSTDVYMVAKCMIYLAGGDPMTNRMPDTVPPVLQRFIKSLLLEGQKMRPDDAWALHDEVSDFAKKLYGPPRFVTLHMS